VWEEGGPFKFLVILVVSLGLLVLIVFMDNGQRRIPVTFARRVVGRREMGGKLDVHTPQGQPVRRDSDHLRLVRALHPGPDVQHRAVGELQHFVTTSLTPTNFFYIAGDFLLIVAFTFFYVYIAFEPHQQAEMLRQQGGFVPGIRPGLPTEKYFARMLSRLTVVGAVFLASVAVTPSILMALWNIKPLPVLRHHLVDCGGRLARNDAPDRQPTHDAQLRRLPEALVMTAQLNLVVLGKAGRRQGNFPEPAPGRALTDWRTSPPGISCAPPSRPATPLGREVKSVLDSGRLGHR